MDRFGEDAGRRRRTAVGRLASAAAAVSLLAAIAGTVPARADFPFARAGADSHDYTDLYLAPGQTSNDLGGNEFKYAATPDTSPEQSLINMSPVELGGVRGAHVVDDDPAVSTAFMTTTGRPDVTIAILDSGIMWNDLGAMNDLRFKTRLSQGELPVPQNDGLATPNVPGEDCSPPGDYNAVGSYDLNDGVFNLRDYSCDGRVAVNSPRGVGPAGLFEPQDILIAFSDGVDDDGNGYVDDIVGWDFLDDDNDPFDDVQYGHGTGEAEDSVAEGNNGNDLGSCPNCLGVYLRVGDSFVADINRFGAAVTYATDNDVEIVQEALGTLNNSSFARDAVNYAYRHGVTIMASAADEAAQHNNWPSTLPHVIVTNSVTTSDIEGAPSTLGTSYLSFNGCTNFNAKVTLAIPSTSCSSNAVGLAAGYAGLVYSAAYNAHDLGLLPDYPDPSSCQRSDGSDCVITPNEVRQVMASGTLNSAFPVDDVNFAGTPGGSGNEPSCSPAPLPDCTSPYGPAHALQDQVDVNRPSLVGPEVALTSYPARKGFDQFYGYGRVNMNRTLNRVLTRPTATALPPEAEIFSPEWFEPLDPTAATITVAGKVFARGAPYRCQILVAPGQYPNNALTTASPPGDFAALTGNGWCDGSTVHSGAQAAAHHSGALGTISVGALKARFPVGTDFTGPIPQASRTTGNGRPFFAPQAFTYKVVVTATTGPQRTGQDQRSSYLHHDAALLPGFPKAIQRQGVIGSGAPSADGESSPAFADLNGDNRNELIFASSDGFVHALRRDGSELSGWPTRSDRAGFVGNHLGAPVFAGGAISNNFGGMFLGSVAVGDPDHDGIPTVFAADYEGKIYGWAPDGSQVFEEESQLDYSGRPRAPFQNVRNGELNRTGHGFFGSPVLADLDRDGDEEIVAAAMDRHVYAFEAEDTDPLNPGGADRVPGYPVLVVDPAKVASVDPTTHAINYRADAAGQQQGAIIDTPAIGDLSADPGLEIVIGTNEEYTETPNVSAFNASSLGFLGQSGIISPGNARLYLLKARGGRDADPLPGDALVSGWPKPLGLLLTGLLPVVGEGVTGNPVIGPASCPNGGAGSKIGALSVAGPAYILNPDGSSCYGTGPDGYDITLQTDFTPAGNYDHPVLPAVGHPAFGNFAATTGSPSLLTPAAGIIRALDLAAPDYQGGQDFVAVWDTTSGQFRPNFPVTMNDLQFLTGPSIADIDGAPGEELLAGSASQDFAAYSAQGLPVPGWPKLSTDWSVANPLIGSFGSLDTDSTASKVVVTMTRSGYISAFATGAPACSPSSWPRFHHDNANSGDYGRDAILPGVPMALRVNGAGDRIRFEAPGDDLLCGKVDHYEIVDSNSPIDESNFDAAGRLNPPPSPRAPGAAQNFGLPGSVRRYVAVRAVDEQGNIGRVVMIDLGPGVVPPGDDCTVPLSGATDRADTLTGTRLGDRIAGRGGDDRIFGRAGNDCIFAHRGDDLARGNHGDDLIRGLAGNDRLAGGIGDDRVGGGVGDDFLRGGGEDDRLLGGDGADHLRGDRGDDTIKGGLGEDWIEAGNGDDTITALGGFDRVKCGGGRDTVVAGRRDRIAADCERLKIRSSE